MLQETQQDTVPISYTSDTFTNPGTVDTVTTQSYPYSTVYEQPVTTTTTTTFTSIPLQETAAATTTTVPNTTNTATAATTEVGPQTIYKIIPGVERREKEKILALILLLAGFCCPVLWCCGSCFMTKHYSGGTRIIGGVNMICCVLATCFWVTIGAVVLAISLGVGLGVGLQDR